MTDSNIVEGLRSLAVPIDTVVEDPANTRIHDAESVARLATMLAQFGQHRPIVVQKSGRIIRVGNGIFLAARSLGWPEIAALVVDEDDPAAMARAISDNRAYELGKWDAPALAKTLEELCANVSLEDIGFGADEIDDLHDRIAANQPPSELDDSGPEAPPAKPVTRTGELWALGQHRILCGDSTKLEDVQRVMAGEKAALVATDPPYLVDYVGDRPNDSGKDWSATYREIDMGDAETFFRSLFTNVKHVIAEHAAIYCWHAHKRCGVIQRVWEELGILDHQQIIWVKPTAVFGRVFWHFKHEPCMMGWVQGSAPTHDGDPSITSVWELDYDGKGRIVGNEHPMQKPLALFARPMRKHTKPGDLVFEPFSGSGSQLIAAEMERRRCVAMEISPAFVDVAVRRWEAATGRAATLEGDGRSFAEIAAERESSRNI